MRMRDARAGWGGVIASTIGCLAACSSNGLVLESRHGDPAPSGDAGSVSTSGDAGPLTGVDSEALRSGGRVHVSVYASGGQFLSVRSAHDTQHDVDCQIAFAEDGVPRCLPYLGVVDSKYAQTGVAFRDADCTVPVVYVFPFLGCGASAPAVAPFVIYQTDKACPQPKVTHVVAPGAEIDPQLPLFQWNLGVCQPASSPVAHAYDAVPSPPTDWVSFERTVVSVTPELGIVHWTGSDGARVLGDIRLLPKDIPCEPLGIAGAPLSPPSARAEYHCVPSNRVYPSTGVLFSDAACTVTAAIAPDCDPPDLLVLSDPQTGSCGNEGFNFFAVGRVVPNSGVYTSVNAPCRPAEGLLGGLTAYQQGAAVDPATFPALQARPEGTGSLQHWVWQAGGAYLAEASPGEWSDTASGAPASATTYSDGVQRGVFSTSFLNEPYYADAACAKPLLAIQTPSVNGQGAMVDCASGAYPRWVLADASTTFSSCPTMDHEPFVRAVGAAYSGAVFTTIANYNERGTSACSAYVPSKSALSYDFHELGDPVPASSAFASIQTVDL
jgi:hypothetical protein